MQLRRTFQARSKDGPTGSGGFTLLEFLLVASLFAVAATLAARSATQEARYQRAELMGTRLLAFTGALSQYLDAHEDQIRLRVSNNGGDRLEEIDGYGWLQAIACDRGLEARGRGSRKNMAGYVMAPANTDDTRNRAPRPTAELLPCTFSLPAGADGHAAATTRDKDLVNTFISVESGDLVARVEWRNEAIGLTFLQARTP